MSDGTLGIRELGAIIAAVRREYASHPDTDAVTYYIAHIIFSLSNWAEIKLSAEFFSLK